MPEIELEVGGLRFGAWKQIRVTRTLEAMAPTFTLGVSDSNEGPIEARPIQLEDECTVRLGAELLVTGIVDDLTPSISGTAHGIEVAGRGLTGDVVDCGRGASRRTWRNLTLTDVVRDLAEPFGVEVRARVDVGDPFPNFTLKPGERTFAGVQRACRARGVLPSEAVDGVLELVQVQRGDPLGITLREGENFEAGSATYSRRGRFSEYRIIGQQRSTFASPESAAIVRGTATDPDVRRYRPLEIVASQPGTASQFTRQARWEASHRAGQAQRVTLTVPSWTVPGTEDPWPINRLVPVDSPSLNVRRELLIAGVTWTVSASSGRIAQLSLQPPEAFDVLPLEQSAEPLWA